MRIWARACRASAREGRRNELKKMVGGRRAPYPLFETNSFVCLRQQTHVRGDGILGKTIAVCGRPVKPASNVPMPRGGGGRASPVARCPHLPSGRCNGTHRCCARSNRSDATLPAQRIPAPPLCQPQGYSVLPLVLLFQMPPLPLLRPGYEGARYFLSRGTHTRD